MNYYIKAAYAGLVTFLGSLLAALQAGTEALGLGDLGTASWITIVLATIITVGGVLGLQAAPASISTSIKEG
jgi:hypothetical protein